MRIIRFSDEAVVLEHITRIQLLDKRTYRLPGSESMSETKPGVLVELDSGETRVCHTETYREAESLYEKVLARFEEV